LDLPIFAPICIGLVIEHEGPQSALNILLFLIVSPGLPIGRRSGCLSEPLFLIFDTPPFARRGVIFPAERGIIRDALLLGWITPLIHNARLAID
jgi:hypothetical protein